MFYHHCFSVFFFLLIPLPECVCATCKNVGYKLISIISIIKIIDLLVNYKKYKTTLIIFLVIIVVLVMFLKYVYRTKVCKIILRFITVKRLFDLSTLLFLRLTKQLINKFLFANLSFTFSLQLRRTSVQQT